MNAAGEWNYDMEAAPRDSTPVLLSWEYNYVVYAESFEYYMWWSGGEALQDAEPFAWATINTPEVPK